MRRLYRYQSRLERFFFRMNWRRARRSNSLFIIRRLILAGFLIVLASGFTVSGLQDLSFKTINIDYESPQQSIECLAKNIYFESRGESRAGQIAVAQVVMNRVKDRRWPNTACKVIQDKKQFEWVFDKVPDEMLNQKAKTQAFRIASAAFKGDLVDPTNGATCYVAKGVRMIWMYRLKKQRLGNHYFMRC
ncbi:MAG: cell wall hydrolase [Gammaproteobacteria bacterium]|nr:cell wall hydrolase [Gammaproteobacteria bacterium]MDH5728252.1 cell wall hydrolase [Gammaproteobacteria bacterium]